VECMDNYNFLQALFTLALFACYYNSLTVMVVRKNIHENAW